MTFFLLSPWKHISHSYSLLERAQRNFIYYSTMIETERNKLTLHLQVNFVVAFKKNNSGQTTQLLQKKPPVNILVLLVYFKKSKNVKRINFDFYSNNLLLNVKKFNFINKTGQYGSSKFLNLLAYPFYPLEINCL